MVSNTPVATALKPLTGAGLSRFVVLMYGINKGAKKHMLPLRSAHILAQLRERVRYLHCSLRTDEAYVYRQQQQVRPIHVTAQSGNTPMTALLLMFAADASLASEDGKRAADYARAKSHLELALRLDALCSKQT